MSQNPEYEIININRNIIVVKHIPCGEIINLDSDGYISSNLCNKCRTTNFHKLMTKDHEVFIREVETLGGGDYRVIGDYVNSKTKIKIEHKECGKSWSILPSKFLEGTRCPKCYESKGEKTIAVILNKYNIEHIRQYKLEKCRNKRPLPFDFAIFKNGLLFALIEFQGIQHYEPIDIFGGEEKFKKTVINDQIKDYFCKKSKLKLLKISYKEIDNIERIIYHKIILKLNQG